MALIPDWLHRMPACLQRSATTCLQADSMAPAADLIPFFAEGLILHALGMFFKVSGFSLDGVKARWIFCLQSPEYVRRLLKSLRCPEVFQSY